MVRSVDRDFNHLCSFVKEYSLASMATGSAEKPLLRKAHKLYLSLLHLWAQCHHRVQTSHLSMDGAVIAEDSDLLTYLREAVSDVGNGFFCCLHGAYKPAHMALRSSIENFLRFISGTSDSAALTTTSVYDLFDIAKTIPPLSGTRSTLHSSLRADYKELCKFTHSASLVHMSGVHALSHFPCFEGDAFDSWNSHAESVCTAMASAICLSDRSIYLKAHYKTKEILDLLLPTAVRLEIMNSKGLHK